MKIELWLDTISQAYEKEGARFSQEKQAFLLERLPDTAESEHKRIFTEVSEVIFRLFFSKAIHGETFGPIDRIREEFGQSLEENYGRKSGPFLNMAKTFWTFKIEYLDLFEEHRDTALYKLLSNVEFGLSSAFFPTPGPMQNSTTQQIELQRKILKEYAPSIDINEFLSDNPMLKKEKSSGCIGILLFVILVPLWIFLDRFHL